MCIIFAAFLLLMVIISIIGFQKGDPYKIVTPFDASGNICGESVDFEDYPYLYWPEAISEASGLDPDAYQKTICIKECPVEGNYDEFEC